MSDRQGEVDGLVVGLFGAGLVLADEGAAGVFLEDGAVVGDHDDGGPLGVDAAEQAHDAVGGLAVQVAGGLVGDDDLGLVEEGAGDGDALLFAAGELVRHLVGLAAHAYVIQHFRDALADGLAVFPAGGPEDEIEVVLDAAVRQQLEVLEHDAEFAAEVGDVLVADAFEGIAADFAFALFQDILGDHGPDERSLAGADLADDVDEVAGTDFHVKAVDDGRFAVEDVGFPEGDDGRGVFHVPKCLAQILSALDKYKGKFRIFVKIVPTYSDRKTEKIRQK